MNKERTYFSECGEWSNQERDFASHAIQTLGIAAWHDLLRVQRSEGKEAFLRAVFSIFPHSTPLSGEL